jgi:hypothetical protein
MRRTSVTAIFLSMVMLVMSAPAVMGDAITITRISGYYTGSGGEFNITPVGGALPGVLSSYASVATYGGGFESFCIEKNEYIGIPETVNFTMTNSAVNGGVSGGNPDPISKGTAFLYSQFAAGTLAGYTYTTAGGNRSVSAGQLQNAIWCLEGEGSCESNPFLSLVDSTFGNRLAAEQANGGTYAVMALNNTTPGGTRRQDMLVYGYREDGGGLAAVPEPGSMLLLGSGLLGLGSGLFRKKVRK